MAGDADTGALERRIDRLVAGLPRMESAAVLRSLDAIRALADARGLRAAAVVAHLVALAVETGVGHGIVAGWLPVLRDAVASGRGDPQASACYAAACSVRLAG